MENISTLEALKSEILQLELKQAFEGQLLKEQFYITYESLKPLNLFKSTLLEVVRSPFLIDNILGTAAGLASGYLSKKMVVGGSLNVFRKLLGILTQLGVTNTVTQHPETVKSFGHYIYEHLLRLIRDKH